MWVQWLEEVKCGDVDVQDSRGVDSLKKSIARLVAMTGGHFRAKLYAQPPLMTTTLTLDDTLYISLHTDSSTQILRSRDIGFATPMSQQLYDVHKSELKGRCTRLPL